jgi:kinetochore protein Mis13/DSN1
LPHPDIAYDDFHKHIKADFPEPVRMKQLLAWCARRALDEQKAKYASTESSNPAAIGINASLQNANE